MHQGREQEDVVLRRRRRTPITAHEARAPGVVDTLPQPLVGANLVSADDCYYAQQIARIVARLRLLRRKRLARYKQTYSR